MITRFSALTALALVFITNTFAEKINLGIEITEIMYDSPQSDSDSWFIMHLLTRALGNFKRQNANLKF
jgi:hypothetical protein